MFLLYVVFKTNYSFWSINIMIQRHSHVVLCSRGNSIIFTEVEYFIVGIYDKLFFSASWMDIQYFLEIFVITNKTAMHVFVQTPGVCMVPFS